MGCSHLMWHFFHVASTWKSSLRDSISNPKIIIINDLKCKNSKKCERKEEKEREKKKKWRCARRSNHTRSRLPRDPGRHARPRLPRTTCVLSLQPLFLGFFFFFFFFDEHIFFSNERIFSGIAIIVVVVVFFAVVVVVVFFVLFLDVETRFPCRCHVEKMSHQTRTTHENRVPKTWFIDPNSSLLDSNC